MTVDKTKLGNKRKGLNAVADEINTNETDVATNAAAITVLNNRADHSQSTTAIVKYPLMAVATWDFAADGADVGSSYDLNSGTNIIPEGAIIRNVFVDVVTAIVSDGSQDATVTFNLKTAATALSTALDKNSSGQILGVPDHATVADWIKTTAADSIEVEIGGTEDPQEITAGYIKIFIEYVMASADPSA